MMTSKEVLQAALDGWQQSRDIEKFVDAEAIQKAEPEIMETVLTIEQADRRLVLMLKGAISVRDQ